MDEIFVKERTLPEAYHKALMALQNAPVIPCPDWNTEQKEVSMTYVVTEPLADPMISRLFIGDPHSLEQYRQEMLDGIMDFEIERGNWVYTYHSRYENQYPFILEELRRNPWSRRAVMDIARRKIWVRTTPPAGSTRSTLFATAPSTARFFSARTTPARLRI